MDALEIISKIKFLFEHFGTPLVFVSSFVEITPFGWTIPGGLVIATASYFSYPDVYLFIKTIISGWFGAWLSLIGGYILGRKTGYWLVKKLKQEKSAERAKKLLKKNGPLILTSSMLANITRFWSAYIAGVEKHRFQNFLIFSAIASLGWVLIVAFIGFLAGVEKGNFESIISSLGTASWIIIIIAIFIIIASIKAEKEGLEKNENHKTK